MKHYSRQREEILNVLRSTDTHPTAKEIYERVQQTIPNISLGTVYRNLSELSMSGDILSIRVGEGYDHFDGDISPHMHLNCRNCGSITDLHINEELLSKIISETDFTPDTSVLVVYGICSKCKTKN